MSRSYLCLSLVTSSTRSPSRTAVLFHSGSLSVDETTYFGIELNLSPNSPSTCGQTAANDSKVTRPSSWASEAIVSSTLNWFPSEPREKSSVQPTRSNPSVPLGASTTPSTEMYSVTTSLPMWIPLSVELKRAWQQTAPPLRSNPAPGMRTNSPPSHATRHRDPADRSDCDWGVLRL